MSTTYEATAAVASAVDTALSREDVPIHQSDVSSAGIKVTAGVMSAIANSPNVALVSVQSPTLSKVNWAQLVMLVLTLLTYAGIDIDDHTKLVIVEGLVAVGTVVTVIFKTFFTKSITSTSK